MSATTDGSDGRARRIVRGAAVPLTAADLDKVRLVVAEALWQAAAAGDLPVARSAVHWARASAPGRASVIGSEAPVSAEAAVLANAALVHARLVDDAHPGVLAHPGAVVVPTVLALAQERGSSGDDIVRSIAAGYRAFALAAAPAAEQVAARGLRNTAVFGPIAAAVAASALARLPEQRAVAAVMIASASAGGTLQAFRAGSPEWRLQPGIAAQLGITAMRWAAAADDADLDYPPTALEGPGGLYETLGVVRSESDRGAEAGVEDGLAGTTVKIHATCGANQMPLEVLGDLLARHRFGVADVEAVEVELERAGYEYPGCEDRGPFTPASGMLSRPLALAAVLLEGAGPLTADVLERALADDRLAGTIDRIRSRVREAPGAAPRHPQDALVRVVLRDGRVLEGTGEPLLDRLRRPDLRGRAEAAARGIGPVAHEIADRAAALPAGDADGLLAPLR